jgi:hypothetical protein
LGRRIPVGTGARALQEDAEMPAETADELRAVASKE